MVGSYAPNSWGLYDLHGNVWEIVLDAVTGYEPQTYVCGGSFQNPASGCKWTASWRQDPASGSYITGFRILARTK